MAMGREEVHERDFANWNYNGKICRRVKAGRGFWGKQDALCTRLTPRLWVFQRHLPCVILRAATWPIISTLGWNAIQRETNMYPFLWNSDEDRNFLQVYNSGPRVRRFWVTVCWEARGEGWEQGKGAVNSTCVIWKMSSGWIDGRMDGYIDTYKES